jgi:hypothetical protein
MEEIGKALKTVFDKIADFFDLFDLSFFVSGIATGSTFIYLHYLFNDEISIPIEEGFLKTLLVIVFFYVIGLISFVFGRWLRQALFWKKSYKQFDKRVRAIINVHNLSSTEPYKTYLAYPETDRGVWRLYIRLWAKLRDNDKFINSFSLLKRYWVMTATYDGIASSIISWTFLVLYLTFINQSLLDISWQWGIVISAGLILVSQLCVREANRNLYNQAEELIAILANDENT